MKDVVYVESVAKARGLLRKYGSASVHVINRYPTPEGDKVDVNLLSKMDVYHFTFPASVCTESIRPGDFGEARLLADRLVIQPRDEGGFCFRDPIKDPELVKAMLEPYLLRGEWVIPYLDIPVFGSRAIDEKVGIDVLDTMVINGRLDKKEIDIGGERKNKYRARGLFRKMRDNLFASFA